MLRQIEISILVFGCLIIVSAIVLIVLKILETPSRGKRGPDGVAGDDEKPIKNTSTKIATTGLDERLIIPEDVLFLTNVVQKQVFTSFTIIFKSTEALLASESLALFDVPSSMKPPFPRGCLGIFCQPVNNNYESVLYDESITPNLQFLIRDSRTFFAGDRFTGSLTWAL